MNFFSSYKFQNNSEMNVRAGWSRKIHFFIYLKEIERERVNRKKKYSSRMMWYVESEVVGIG